MTTCPDCMTVDRLHEECGVFGIYARGEAVARLTFFGLFALQHRGQESAGIAVTDGYTARIHKDMGLVTQVFNESNLAPLQGHIAVGHTRYSTAGSSRPVSAGPFLIESLLGPIALSHNGNLVNTGELRRKLFERGVGLASFCDSEIIVQLLAGGQGSTMLERIQEMMSMALGAYSLTILTRDALYAVRDPWGFRPLCMGRLNGGWVVASETCALETVGAREITEIAPGVIVKMDDSGATVVQGHEPERSSLCIFEYIYFARPDSILEGQLIHEVRQELGRQLAREHPVDADLVIGIPDSATAAAIGYAQQSRIPFGEGLIKNRYIGRTFIQPSQVQRENAVRIKLNALKATVSGKRVVLVEDSIVRGTTCTYVISLLREAGAAEVHMRVSSPPFLHACYFGTDIPDESSLVASGRTPDEIAKLIGADSLRYLQTDDLPRIVAGIRTGLCDACFTGDYSVPVFSQPAAVTNGRMDE